MANNKKFIVKTGLQTSNINYVSATGGNLITSEMLGTGSLKFSGSIGDLFTIHNSSNNTVEIPSAVVNNVLKINALSANGTIGAPNTVLTSNGSSTFWSTNLGYTGSAGTNGTNGTNGYTGSLGYTGSIGYTGSAGTATTNETPPTSPTDGQFWWNSTQGVLYIFYEDISGGQWVQASPNQIGYTGSIGSLGYTGSVGSLGYTGSTGSGYTGSQGNSGYTGSIGSLGYTGSSGSTDTINATDDTATASLYPVMVGAAGSAQSAKVTTTKLYFDATDGTMTATNFNSLSDRDMKDNIQTITNPMPVLYNIRPASFNWKDTGKKGYGVIAQEIENILPELVHTGQDGKKTVSYDQIIPFLIAAVKKQQTEIDELKYLVREKGHYG